MQPVSLLELTSKSARLHRFSIVSNSSNQPKHLTEQELNQVLGAIKSPRDLAIFVLTYWRGLLASEIGRIQWSDWDQKKRKLYVFRLKGSLAGEFPLSPAEHKALTAFRDVRGNDPPTGRSDRPADLAVTPKWYCRGDSAGAVEFPIGSSLH